MDTFFSKTGPLSLEALFSAFIMIIGVASFFVPYMVAQLLPSRLRVLVVFVVGAALILLFEPLRSLPKPYNAPSSVFLAIVGTAIIAGAIIRTFGPKDKLDPDVEYWRGSIAVGLILSMVVPFLAAMSTDSL